MWYDAPTFSPFTLQANTLYYLGLVSAQSFVYRYDAPGTPVTMGGLTAPNGYGTMYANAYTNPQFAGTNGGVIFSFRASGTNAAPVGTPEPETWAMMGLGLLALGIFQWRRKRDTPQLSPLPGGMAF